ncbi:MAG: sigma-70 family RNA polymerase sigma factor [Oscillospiraceae bacterium]|nr:sigma-70 family RNA polymerase sigma factor [Oscillospiraceae bacterium]
MDKKTADKYIYEYKDKIFGYAMEKMRSIDQAQELASDIICEVYCSFLKSDDIVNLDGYVYRIAQNVRARYIDRLVTGRRVESINDMVIPYNDEPRLEDVEDIEALRREIGYLSDRQRLVIYMHYYDNLSVTDIAAKLRISAGTVKWHLSDARTRLKEGITMNTNEMNLGINPVIFYNMGHCGSSGSAGDTYDMFDTRLKQNIAYACYWEPKTLEEIARTVGVPQAYVADNLEKLVEYAYIDRLDNSKNPKFRTNMLITDDRKAHGDSGSADNRAAELLCEKFFPKIFEEFEADPAHWGFSCDGDDVNFMKYSLVMACVKRLGILNDCDTWKYCVKRPDGGNFIASARVTDDREVTGSTGSKGNPYWTCGTMVRNNYVYNSEDNSYTHTFDAVSLDCRFADRKGGWRDNLNSDWESLVKFINGGRDSLNAEEYKRVCDKGYVHEDKAQPVILRVKLNDGETLGGSLDRLIEEKAIIPQEIERLSKQMDDEAFAALKNNYPEHMHTVLKNMTCTNVIGGSQMVPRVVEKMLEKGMLKPLTDIQRKSVFSVLCLNAE